MKQIKNGTSIYQEQIKGCNNAAGGKKLEGDERKKFMSICLSIERS